MCVSLSVPQDYDRLQHVLKQRVQMCACCEAQAGTCYCSANHAMELESGAGDEWSCSECDAGFSFCEGETRHACTTCNTNYCKDCAPRLMQPTVQSATAVGVIAFTNPMNSGFKSDSSPFITKCVSLDGTDSTSATAPPLVVTCGHVSQSAKPFSDVWMLRLPMTGGIVYNTTRRGREPCMLDGGIFFSRLQQSLTVATELDVEITEFSNRDLRQRNNSKRLDTNDRITKVNGISASPRTDEFFDHCTSLSKFIVTREMKAEGEHVSPQELVFAFEEERQMAEKFYAKVQDLEEKNLAITKNWATAKRKVIASIRCLVDLGRRGEIISSSPDDTGWVEVKWLDGNQDSGKYKYTDLLFPSELEASRASLQAEKLKYKNKMKHHMLHGTTETEVLDWSKEISADGTDEAPDTLMDDADADLVGIMNRKAFQAFNLIDSDMDGMVTWEEFMEQGAAIVGGDTELLKLQFNSLDQNADGQVSIAEYKKVFQVATAQEGKLVAKYYALGDLLSEQHKNDFEISECGKEKKNSKVVGTYVKQTDSHDGRPWYQHESNASCRAFYKASTKRWYLGDSGDFDHAIFQTHNQTDDEDMPLVSERWEGRADRSGKPSFVEGMSRRTLQNLDFKNCGLETRRKIFQDNVPRIHFDMNEGGDVFHSSVQPKDALNKVTVAPDAFACAIDGIIHIRKEALYTFVLESVDSSRLMINDKPSLFTASLANLQGILPDGLAQKVHRYFLTKPHLLNWGFFSSQFDECSEELVSALRQKFAIYTDDTDEDIVDIKDNVGVHPARAKQQTRRLRPGPYYIRVEYVWSGLGDQESRMQATKSEYCKRSGCDGKMRYHYYHGPGALHKSKEECKASEICHGKHKGVCGPDDGCFCKSCAKKMFGLRQELNTPLLSLKIKASGNKAKRLEFYNQLLPVPQYLFMSPDEMKLVASYRIDHYAKLLDQHMRSYHLMLRNVLKSENKRIPFYGRLVFSTHIDAQVQLEGQSGRLGWMFLHIYY